MQDRIIEITNNVLNQLESLASAPNREIISSLICFDCLIHKISGVQSELILSLWLERNLWANGNVQITTCEEQSVDFRKQIIIVFFSFIEWNNNGLSSWHLHPIDVSIEDVLIWCGIVSREMRWLSVNPDDRHGSVVDGMFESIMISEFS